jgi:hypothetical protein
VSPVAGVAEEPGRALVEVVALFADELDVLGQALGRRFCELTSAGSLAGALFDAIGAKARAEMTFAKAGSFAGSVKNQVMTKAGSLGDLIKDIRVAYHRRDELPEDLRWEKEYAVIIGTATADSVVAISANSNDAGLAVTASGKLGPPSSLAEVDARMTVTTSKKAYDKMWSRPASGYGFQAMRLDPSIFRRWRTEHPAFVEPRLRFAESGIRTMSRYSAVSNSEFDVPEPTQLGAVLRAADISVGDIKVQTLTPSGRVAARGRPADVLKGVGKPRRVPTAKAAKRTARRSSASRSRSSRRTMRTRK